MINEDKRAAIGAEEDAVIDLQFALVDAMAAKGMTQTDLAKALGVSRARVSQLLSADANPTLKLVGRALHALGLKAHYGDANGNSGVDAPFEAVVDVAALWDRFESSWGIAQFSEPANDFVGVELEDMAA